VEQVVYQPVRDPDLIRQAARNRSVDEALTHFQLARTADTGPTEHWVSIAFAIVREQRSGSKS
jgi:hypothetical protein